MFHCNQRRRDSGRARSALRMADLRLQRRGWNLLGAIAQRQLDGASFDAVIEFGRGAVQIDVVDLLGRSACVFERQRDCARRFFAIFAEAHAMQRFAGRTVSG